MSFPNGFPGILSPDDVAVLRSVYGRIASEPWVSKDAADQEQFAKYVLRMYCRGLCEPEKLFRFCLIAAKYKLAVMSVAGRAKQSASDQLQR